MSSARLIYLPLGGSGEIGMNCYVYGYGPRDKERLIVVDLGVAFPDMDTTPGVDLIMADVSWLEQRKDQIDGIFITHAHEDHVGAVGHCYAKLGAPIFARRFTANIAQRKLEEHGVSDAAALQIVPAWPHQVKIGSFEVGFLPISHSIPESSGLVIDTPKGRLVHTGDFKLDETPLVGEAWDAALWADIAKKGVKALICDSTNVFSPDAGRSESTLGDNISELVAGAENMVVATTFASNVARVKTLALAAAAAGRSVCLVGRAMRRMITAAIETGVLSDFPTVISIEDATQIPRENLMLLVTGSQGERLAASAQLARGKYRGLSLAAGDMFLFSSKTIPGNERGVIRIMNQLSELGVDVEDDSSTKYHVSGHANRPDLVTMHETMQPQTVIPMHGEHRHLRKHAKLAEQNGAASVVAVNGMMIDLSGNAPQVVDYIDSGRTYLDGTVKIGAMDGVVRERIKMALNGHIMVSLILDNDELLGEAWCEMMGLPEMGTSRASVIDVIEEDLNQFLMRAGNKTLRDDTALEKELKRIARHTAQSEVGKKPEVTVVISRLA